MSPSTATENTVNPYDYTDLIDWGAMDTPPNFHSVLHESVKRDGKETTKATVVITFAGDFPRVASAWPNASPEMRSTMFFLVGRLHYAETELMSLPETVRTEALSVPGVVGPSPEEPGVLATKVAHAVRDARRRLEGAKKAQGQDADPPRMKPDDPEVYFKLRAIRACKPYVGPDDVHVVILRQSIV
jgi:hypothetical protein